MPGSVCQIVRSWSTRSSVQVRGPFGSALSYVVGPATPSEAHHSAFVGWQSREVSRIARPVRTHPYPLLLVGSKLRSLDPPKPTKARQDAAAANQLVAMYAPLANVGPSHAALTPPYEPRPPDGVKAPSGHRRPPTAEDVPTSGRGEPQPARSGRRVAGGRQSAGRGSRDRRSTWVPHASTRRDGANRSAESGGQACSRSAQ